MPHYELVKIEDKGNFILDLDDFISSCIYNNKSWENHLEHIYSEIIKKDFIVVDIGANIGYHSIRFSEFCDKVYAFEPVPYNFNLLCGNIAVNNLSNNITPFCIGLGDKEEKVGIVFQEEVELWWKNSKTTSHKNYGGTVLGKKSSNKNIIVKPLDNLNLNPDVIKIDVEGYELKTFKGAIKTIKKYNPVIFAEIHKDKRKKVFKLLESLNYDTYLIPSYPWDSDFISINPQTKNYKDIVKILDQHNLQKISFG